MNVHIPVQAPPERVYGCEDTGPHAFLFLGYFQQDVCCQCTQGPEKVAIVFEQLPQGIRHCEGDVLPFCVRKRRSHVFDPLIRALFPAGVAIARFTAEADNLFVIAGFVWAVEGRVPHGHGAAGQDRRDGLYLNRPDCLLVSLIESPPKLAPGQ